MISPSSPLALLFASVVVAASSNSAMAERGTVPKLTIQPLKVRASCKHSWRSAISEDDSKRLLSLLTNNYPRSLLSVTASNGKSALMVAAKTGNTALAKALVEAGADVNEATETNGTPFMFAALGDQQEMAQWLLDQGADLNTVGSNGWTALTIAAAKGQVHMLQWLISQGAQTQVRDVYRYTPLIRAVDNGYAEAAAVLLSLVETDVNAQDETHNTALHYAVSAGDFPMVKLLLEHQANSGILNRKGISPLDIARLLASDSRKVLEAMDASVVL